MSYNKVGDVQVAQALLSESTQPNPLPGNAGWEYDLWVVHD